MKPNIKTLIKKLSAKGADPAVSFRTSLLFAAIAKLWGMLHKADGQEIDENTITLIAVPLGFVYDWLAVQVKRLWIQFSERKA